MACSAHTVSIATLQLALAISQLFYALFCSNSYSSRALTVRKNWTFDAIQDPTAE
jgi:hypothetical protein